MNNDSPITTKRYAGTCYCTLSYLKFAFNSLAMKGIADLANLSVFALGTFYSSCCLVLKKDNIVLWEHIASHVVFDTFFGKI